MTWKLYLYAGLLLSFMAGLFYVSHLRTNIERIEAQRDEYKIKAETVSNYIASYEPKKQAGDLKYATWISQADKIEVSEDCVKSVPVAIRSYIDKL